MKKGKGELLEAIEKLAVSVGKGHPDGAGRGFTYDQTVLIGNIIRAAIKTGDFNAEEQG